MTDRNRFRKATSFNVSRRNTRQRDAITTRANRTYRYRISLSCISSANIKRGDFSKSVPVCHPVCQLGIYPIFIYLVMRIELIRAILMPRLSNFLRNSTMHFRVFLNLATCFLRVTVSLLCRLQAMPKIHILIYPYLISEERRKCLTLWPAQQRTVTLGKHVTKHKDMRKWIYQKIWEL